MINQKHKKLFRSGDKIKLVEQTIFGNINVVQQEDLPENVNLNKILKDIQLVIPQHFVQNLDGIYIGTYDFLQKRDLNALYKDGCIYMLPEQDDEADAFEDIVHEIAHCVEETYGTDIYEDQLLEQEFLRKRKALFDILRAYGYTKDMPASAFMNPEFDEKFDEFLYLMVGYPILNQLAPDLFVSPYAATSLREYFANGFEHYFAKREYKRVNKISPSIYEKIEVLLGQ